MYLRLGSWKITLFVGLLALTLLIPACDKSDSDKEKNQADPGKQASTHTACEKCDKEAGVSCEACQQAKEAAAQPAEAKAPVETIKQEVEKVAEPVLAEAKKEAEKAMDTLVAKVEETKVVPIATPPDQGKATDTAGAVIPEVKKDILKAVEAKKEAVNKVVKPKPVKQPVKTAGNLVPLPITLPKPMFVGTPTNIRVPNLKKPLGKPRPPFLAPPGCKNIALEKKVTSSDPEPIIGDLELMTDGDKEGIDGSWVELGPMIQWAQVDLGAKHEIYAVLAWHYHRQARVYFDVIVQVADDPDFITNVRTIFNNDLDNSAGQGIGKDMHYIETSEGHLVDAKGVQARYVRLYSNGSSANDQNHYTEIEIYGKLPGAKATTPGTKKPDPKATGGKLVPLPITLPKPMFVGTPTNIRVPNLMKPLGKPRPPFLAPAGCKNVALDKKVTSSDPEPIIGDLELMADGDKEGIDGSWVELGPMVQWAQIDLGAKHEIYAVLTWHYHRQARVYFDVIVQVADDPDFITNVRTIFNNDLDNSAGQGIGKDMHYIETSEGHLVDAKGVQARYVRLYSNGSSANDQNHYTEIEVYGKPTQ
jgi:hypothetical protein